MRPDAPVVDDGCSSPDGGGVPGKGSGYLNIVPGIYLPGHLAETRPAGYALRIPAGSYLQFQVHYSNHTGEDVKDRTSIGLVFATEPVKHEIAQYEIWNDLFLIPPTTTTTRNVVLYVAERRDRPGLYGAHAFSRKKYDNGSHLS